MDKNNLSPLDRNQTLNNTFTVYFSRFFVLLLVALLLIALPQFLLSATTPASALLDDLQSGSYEGLLERFSLDSDALYDDDFAFDFTRGLFADLVADSFALIMMSLAISVFVTPLAVGAIAFVSDKRARGESATLAEALGGAARRYPNLLVTNLCALLLTIGFAILLCIAFVLAAVLVMFISAGSRIINVLLIILLCIGAALPAVLLGAVSNVALCSAVSTEKSGFGAATYAFKLLFSHFWRHVGLYILIGFATAIAGSIIGWVLGIILPFASLRTLVSASIFSSLGIVAAAMIVYSATPPQVAVSPDLDD